MKIFYLIVTGTLLAGCASDMTLTTSLQTCTAIHRSPAYSGKALDKAGQKPLHRWTRIVNRTLDRLSCPK